MNVAGHRISLLRSSIATSVWGANIRTMITAADAIATSAWNSVWRWARSRSRSSALTSASSDVPAVPASAEGSALTS